MLLALFGLDFLRGSLKAYKGGSMTSGQGNPDTSNIPKDSIDNEFYMRIWEKQQDIAISRWSIITFFMSVSFALFGLSLQSGTAATSSPTLAATVQRLIGLSIYWFSYFLYRRYSAWSHFLRAYLQELEAAGKTTIQLQTRSNSYMAGLGKASSINRLLFFFGLLYLLMVIILWRAGI